MVRRRTFTAFTALLTLLLVAGCEAPLDLEGVQSVSREPVKRYDEFLSVARSSGVTVAVSSAGAVLVSTDGAGSWQRRDLPGAPALIEVDSCPDGTFAALDPRRKVWVSSDGGGTWEPREIDTPEAVTTLTCGPGNRLWVGGSFTTILGSPDRGKNWESTSFDMDAMFTDLQFVDSQVGFGVGEFGTVAYTKDGGDNWELGPSITNDFYPQDALFLDRQTGYVVGLDGKILKTTDGGGTWEYEESPTDAPLYGLTGQGDTLFAVGEGGEMLRLDGNRWLKVDHGKPVRSYLRTALAVNDRNLLIAGGSGALFLVPTQN